MVLLGVAACKSTPCFNADLRFGLISFTEPEADTIVYRRFMKATGFTYLVDSFVCDIRYRKSNDTLAWTYTSGNVVMSSDFDYQLYFPGAGKVYRITEIKEERKEIKHAFFSPVKVGCINNISSLKIDGIAIVPPGYNYFYLKK